MAGFYLYNIFTMNRIHAICYTLTVALLVAIPRAKAQGEIDDQDKIFFRNERTAAFNLYTDGIAFNYSIDRRVNARLKRGFELEINNFRHPKEKRISTGTTPYASSGLYVYGKANYPVNFRLGYDRQKELYKKHDRGGISVRRFYAFGPQLTLLKPVYYEVEYNLGEIEYERFDLKNPYKNINGTASFFRGFDEITIRPGAYARAGMSFEFSKKDDKVSAFDTGVTLNAFLEPIEIMAGTANPQIFANFFIGYRFGKVKDLSEVKKEKIKARKDIIRNEAE